MRKKMTDDEKKKKISLSIDNKLYKLIETTMKEKNLKRSQVIDMIMNKMIKEYDLDNNNIINIYNEKVKNMNKNL